MRIFEPQELKDDLKNKRPLIFAHWHQDELALLHVIKRYKICTISSQSKDGEIMNTVIRLIGGNTVRGSSSRGAVQALKGLLRYLIQVGGNTSFAVDGPRGPIYQIKPGVFEVSRFLGSQTEGGKIFPAGVAVSRFWQAHKAWNKAILPKPFSVVTIVWGASLKPIAREQDPRAESLKQDLGLALNHAKQIATEKLYSLE